MPDLVLTQTTVSDGRAVDKSPGQSLVGAASDRTRGFSVPAIVVELRPHHGTALRYAGSAEEAMNFLPCWTPARPRPTQAGYGWKRGGELLAVVKDGSLHDPQTGERVCGLAGLGAPRASLYLAL